jgi:hypothetical protein
MRSSLLVLIVVVVAAGAFFWLRRGDAPPPPAPPVVERVEPPGALGEIRTPPNPSEGAVPSTQIPPARVAAPAQLVARPASEWQGMLIDLSVRPYCEKSDQCGMARACRGNACINCVADGDCAGGEVCVLDQCVVQSLAACRRAADCKSGELCVLSEYSADPRGNTGMRAFCQSSRGGRPPTEPQLRQGEYQAPPVRIDELTDQLHRDAAP